jgi:hypothetical protein
MNLAAVAFGTTNLLAAWLVRLTEIQLAPAGLMIAVAILAFSIVLCTKQDASITVVRDEKVGVAPI